MEGRHPTTETGDPHCEASERWEVVGAPSFLKEDAREADIQTDDANAEDHAVCRAQKIKHDERSAPLEV